MKLNTHRTNYNPECCIGHVLQRNTVNIHNLYCAFDCSIGTSPSNGLHFDLVNNGLLLSITRDDDPVHFPRYLHAHQLDSVMKDRDTHLGNSCTDSICDRIERGPDASFDIVEPVQLDDRPTSNQ